MIKSTEIVTHDEKEEILIEYIPTDAFHSIREKEILQIEYSEYEENPDLYIVKKREWIFRNNADDPEVVLRLIVEPKYER